MNSVNVAAIVAVFAVSFVSVDAADDKSLYITVDNEMELYIDGIRHEVSDNPNGKDWQQTKQVKLPDNVRTIAVKGKDLGGGYAGLIASADGVGLLSDATWKVTTTEVSGWTLPDFDDSQWETASEIGVNGMNPWKKRNQINDNAKWIWTGKLDPVVFFRYKIKSSKSPEQAGCKDVITRVDCGWIGIPQEQCASFGCCYEPSIKDVIWCFYGSEETNPCSARPCQNKGVCKPTGGEYKCFCPPEFNGDQCEFPEGAGP